MKKRDTPYVFNAELLRQEREKRNMTQLEFAKVCSVGQVQLSRYEGGAAVPKVETVKRITKNLDLPSDYFWTGKGKVDLVAAREAFLSDLEIIKNSVVSADQLNAMHSVIKMVLTAIKLQKLLDQIERL